ncbi:multisubunit potassium/proton antiporter, PhaA subunit /multisubunit potassium/proton antiporter, PhaB subunit [Devosia lucknowensis]|uniref:Multisubunit potassium/proton antiporter, PhaA subunit /multisubunit potassium/proton antiporter, PhaB subunit n=2 Tax=Devosia lucknowensis TaxID=1096929 RepID=A0A1Y6EUV9_9HYPH|nr:monovalent cation/H+ antiporter subunit A [Devosia lucknowensis]SMQ63983.1 multisubunit potassium/proton antiporter, PhaA subunit /multisubunit potassium/proton antiporter, PhaB subunit [Devosia lucknowensis]
MLPAHILLFVVAAPFVTALIAASFPATARNAEAWLSGILSLVLLGISIALYPQIADGGVIRHEIEWLPSLGLNLIFRMDGFAWLFCVMITGIGFLVVLYTRYYMSPKDPVPRFFAFLLAFMGAMLGLVTAGNIIQLAIFWELTSVISFLLIGYWYHRSDARDGARMALIVTATGGLALFAGLLVIGQIVGSYDLDVILASGDTIRDHSLYTVALVLMLLGAMTKSAQFPFQFWLPHAMAAPTPVSAYLHSATMVKAGVFLLVRFWPVMAGTDAWFWIVTFAGLITLMIGAYAALFQRDLKGLLAYSTISHLGLITTLLGMSSPLALVAAVFHIANHATFKASLFMAAGIIDHETGTRDIRRLSGLYRFMPFTATLAMIASAAMAGVPLLNGFLSKEMFFTETAEYDPNIFVNLALPVGATIAGMFSVAYSLRFVHGVFFGPPPEGLDKEPHEPPALMRRPIELLVLICLAVGIIPGITIGPYLAAAVTSVLGDDVPYYSLSVWHGFNLPLIMSIVALVGGVLLYLALFRYLASGQDGTPLLHRFRGQRIFEKVLVTVTWRWARALNTWLGTRRLQPQLLIIVALAILAGAVPLWNRIGAVAMPVTAFDPVFALMWGVGGACALAAAYQAKFHRFAALILLGGAGLVTCMTFVWFSAPDLALTQLVVEIATTVLILLGLRWLPQRLPTLSIDAQARDRFRRYRDMIVAAIAGIGLALMSYLIMTRPAVDGIASFFLDNAYSQGGGTNVVNVMLVDFRAFDTFGEIAVLGVVALTVFALLRRFRPAAESLGKTQQQLAQNAFDESRPERNPGDTVAAYLLVPSQIMQWLFPVIIVVAVYLFMRGHDLPGGGFVGGLTMSIAFILQYMAGGTRWVEDRLRILPVIWIGSGLGIALLTGVGSWLFGYPFLTTYFQYAEIPWIGRVPLATALIFDLGVFLLVVGSTVLILIALAHQSVRSPRVSRAARRKAAPVAEDGGAR